MSEDNVSGDKPFVYKEALTKMDDDYWRRIRLQKERRDMIRREYGFKKGQITNPKGRSKKRQDLADLCKTWTFQEGGFEKLVSLTECGDPKTELKAAELIIGYAVGKPSTVLEDGENTNHTQINLAVFSNNDLKTMLKQFQEMKDEKKPVLEATIIEPEKENGDNENEEKTEKNEGQ